MNIKILLIVCVTAGVIALAIGEFKYHQSRRELVHTSMFENQIWLAGPYQTAQEENGSTGLVSSTELAEIRSPFYITEFSIILITCLIVAFVSINYYTRIRDRVRKDLEIQNVRLEERYILRKEIARDFHDEMGNHLARIISYVGLVRAKGQNIDETLGRIEESAKDLIGETRDFVWALDPQNENVFDLFVHVKDFGERLFSGHPIEFSTRYEIASVEKLPLNKIRQINLILKELLTNALKHSQSNSVELVFASVDHAFDISVYDNGIGIDREEVNWHDGGLSNILYRAKKIDASLSIHNGIGVGTVANLRIEILNS